jgi:hypothetical protein
MVCTYAVLDHEYGLPHEFPEGKPAAGDVAEQVLDGSDTQDNLPADGFQERAGMTAEIATGPQRDLLDRGPFRDLGRSHRHRCPCHHVRLYPSVLLDYSMIS